MLTLQIKEKEIENLTPEEEFVRGTVGAKCQINFDEFWQSYNKYIVFKRVGYEPINFMVDTLENEIEIPYTILAESGEFKIGVFGTTETETLPTLYSKDIKILYGTDTHGTTPPTYIPSEIDQLRLSKQDKLVSGTNIKTINNQSILGSGNITIEGGSGSSITIDQTFNPESENAQSGKAVSEAISPVRQTITVDTPVWTVQPTIEGVLNEAFEIWSIRPYFVTLKNTDGTDLESRQFKLCTTLDGYASAIDQIFTLDSSSVTLSENLPVDFKSISLDRTKFEMRDAGVSSVYIKTNNLKSQRYVISAYQSAILKSAGTKYIYLVDSIGNSLGTKATYYSPVGAYNAYNGFLLQIANSSSPTLFKIGYRIEAVRTKHGFVINLIGLTSARSSISQYGYSDISDKSYDFTEKDLSSFNLNNGTNGHYYGNGTVITLEEFE